MGGAGDPLAGRISPQVATERVRDGATMRDERTGIGSAHAVRGAPVAAEGAQAGGPRRRVPAGILTGAVATSGARCLTDPARR